MKIIVFLSLIMFCCIADAQTITNPLLTPVGAVKSFSPNITLANNTASVTSMLGSVKDTIRANTLVPYRPYRAEMALIVNTPALSLPNLALNVKFGGVTVAMVNSTTVLAGLVNAGIRIRLTIISTSMTSQMVLTEIIQPNGNIINITNANGSFYKETAINTSVPQVLDVEAAWSGLVILGTATIKSVWYYRPDF